MRELSQPEVDALVESIDEQGFAIMEGAMDDELLGRIREEIERLEDVRPGGDIAPGPFTGHVTRRWFDLLNDGDVWQDVAVHPWVLAVLPRVLGDNYLLSTMGTAIVGDGEDVQMLHVDDGVYQFPRPHPNLVCNTMWAIDDFTAANGATHVVPGSNNWDEDPDASGATEYETTQLVMPAGSIAFVVGTCYHGAGANRSGVERQALTINYCNGRMRQQENLMLGVRPERMMQFSRTLQDLLGFTICQGAGHIFASDPRVELERRYGGQGEVADPYMERRNALQVERIGAPKIVEYPEA